MIILIIFDFLFSFRWVNRKLNRKRPHRPPKWHQRLVHSIRKHRPSPVRSSKVRQAMRPVEWAVRTVILVQSPLQHWVRFNSSRVMLLLNDFVVEWFCCWVILLLTDFVAEWCCCCCKINLKFERRTLANLDQFLCFNSPFKTDSRTSQTSTGSSLDSKASSALASTVGASNLDSRTSNTGSNLGSRLESQASSAVTSKSGFSSSNLSSSNLDNKSSLASKTSSKV